MQKQTEINKKDMVKKNNNLLISKTGENRVLKGPLNTKNISLYKMNTWSYLVCSDASQNVFHILKNHQQFFTVHCMGNEKKKYCNKYANIVQTLEKCSSSLQMDWQLSFKLGGR